MRARFRFLRVILRLSASALVITHVLLAAGMAAGHRLPRGGLLAFSVPVNRISQWIVLIMDMRSRLIVQVAEYSWRLAVPLAWSPDGSQIAFATYAPRSDIYVVDVYSGRVRNLTNDWADDRYPTWSPDGKYIAFFTNRDYLSTTRYEIYLVDLEGSPARRLTYNEALYPTWSPDGSQLVYTSRQEGDLYRLHTTCLSLPESCQQSRLTRTLYDDRNPVWSPDSQTIAFLSFPPPEYGVSSAGTGEQIFLMDRDGGGLRLLASGWRYQGMPAWSPDSRLLAFVGKAWAEQVDSLYVTDPYEPSKPPRKLVDDAYYAYNERWSMWSPDSRYIAYSRRHTGGLYVVDVTTGHAEKLSNLPATYPVWQPHG